MKNDRYDKYICDIFITKKLKINGNQIRKLSKYPNIKNYLINRYEDESNIQVVIWRIYYHVENRQVCQICGKLTKFDLKNKEYKKYCCASCSAKSKERNEKYKKTCLEKYNHINPLHNIDIRNKYINDWISKYGVDNPSKSKVIQEKCKQTCLKRYGVEYSFQSENNKQKAKLTKLQKYGNENFVNLEKRKQTCIKKYNANSVIESEYFKEKAKQTLLNKYGVDNYFKLQENIEKSHSSEVINKINESKRKNKTFNTSKPEIKTYELLKEKYPDIMRQYKSDVYPFACDFYIPSLDLYIECNYHWTHGGKLYENTIEDNKKLEYWKSKNTKYYNNAIKTWTIYDVKKYNIAKENNLNYLLFYNINEFKNWLNNEV